jgi:hypothetical protein
MLKPIRRRLKKFTGKGRNIQRLLELFTAMLKPIRKRRGGFTKEGRNVQGPLEIYTGRLSNIPTRHEEPTARKEGFVREVKG